MTPEQRILCLGNETEDTDVLTTQLAVQNGFQNRGLVTDPLFVPELPGYYHTTVVDLNEGQIRNIAKHFDLVIWLDQSQDDYPHFKTFLRTFRLIKHLEQNGTKVQYFENQNAQNVNYWWNFLRTNQSFCHHPFLALIPVQGDKTNICPKTDLVIKSVQDIVDWRSDSDYRQFRDKMLAGKKLHLHCADCYDKENKGVESTRQFETLEWAVKMKLKNEQDFDQVPDPVFYEIRPSNKCNIMCRMCDDARSHLIEKENIQLGKELIPWRFQDLPFEKIKLETLQRIYVGGGEPTIMPEFYDFLENCIAQNKTDFELCIGTNGMKFSNKLINLLSHFNDVVLSVSFDGYGIVNDYIRWRSDFDTVVANTKMMRSLGHKIGLQTVPSMYNLTNLHKLFEFFDQEFPESSCLVQAAQSSHGLEPWNHPFPELVVASMEQCFKTNTYLANGRSCQGYVEGIHAYYSNPDYSCNPYLLKKFFKYNDELDRARNSRLGDYIPELENARKLILNLEEIV
jgi:hypothetical protein